MAKYLMALDAGTTSSRTILFTRGGEIAGTSQYEFTQIYPKAGYVEHDPMEIWETQKKTIIEVMEKTGVSYKDIEAIGITNQRETTVVWDKKTGLPVYNAIVWQCRRTADMIEKLKADGLSDYVKDTTGLIPDPYFSGTKIAWILENISGVREKAENGELLFGTIDTWLTWNLTGGKVHVTDVTNASRTMLYDIHKLCWDEKLLKYFNIPASMLPAVVMSSQVVGESLSEITGGPIKIAGMAGDQQCALFGQCCFNPGDVKNTYGTGCFTLMNTGESAVKSKNGLVTTIASGIDGHINYALEGSVFVAGAAIQWLRDELHLIEKASESEKCCYDAGSCSGVYVVPSFAGMGAPYWNPYARGAIFGLTRGSNDNRIIRATVESLAYQVYDLVKAMEQDLGAPLTSLKVDGGASANNFLMQFQSDILDISLERPSCIETTGLGAAYLAGLATGFYKNLDEIKENRQVEKIFLPDSNETVRNARIDGWHKAVRAALFWAEN